MGRNKKVLTPEEIADRKTRWWGEERNARRRERYQKDESYRQQTIQAVRSRYRVVREERGVEVRDDDAAENLAKLRIIGQVRDVSVGEDRSVRMLTFTMDELARAVDRNPQVIYRWRGGDLIPAPIFTGRNMRNRWQPIYVVQEVRAMVAVFSQHQKQSQYYRLVHTSTRERMFEAVRLAREEVYQWQRQVEGQAA